jgi:exonuclease III
MPRPPLNLHIVSKNVRGINNPKKRSIFSWVRKQNADIALLQEVYSSKENENKWKNEWGGQVVYAHGTKHSRGTIVLINPKYDCEVLDMVQDPSG